MGQELDLKVAQLWAAGCCTIISEKESGTKDEWSALQRVLRKLGPGDTLIVSALDRLIRGGPFKMLSILSDITARGATYRSIAEPWADTTHELGEVLAALVGYIARKTREYVLRRTSAGRHRAMLKGVRLGRKPKLSEPERLEALKRRAAGEPHKALAEAFNVSRSTISRLRLGHIKMRAIGAVRLPSALYRDNSFGTKAVRL